MMDVHGYKQLQKHNVTLKIQLCCKDSMQNGQRTLTISYSSGVLSFHVFTIYYRAFTGFFKQEGEKLHKSKNNCLFFYKKKRF